VAFDGNENTGVEIYETSTQSGTGSWHVSGGTSLGAPAWAGIIAIVDQGRALNGKGSLDGPTQTLPALYAAPASDFHSVSSDGGFLGLGGLSSLIGDIFGSGYSGATANIATGLGTPNGPALIENLVTSTTTIKPPKTSAGAPSSSLPKTLASPKKPAGVRKAHHQTHPSGHTTGRTKVRLTSVARRRISARNLHTLQRVSHAPSGAF
jgi:hypothetical protein